MSIGQQVLDVAIQDDDSGATTIRAYLCALAGAVWSEGDGFSGKRPFGNSGWAWDVYTALAKAGLITATFDEDGCIKDAATEKGDALIRSALKELAQQPGEAATR